MAFSTKFSLPSFLRQVNKLTENQRNSIIKVGFGNLLHIPNHFLRRSQLIEMMERWSSEKQAFVFPPGEITITLLDVVLILGLRVIGEPVVLKEDTPITSLEKEFGVSVLNRTISVESLKKKLESLGERDDESFVRVFLLFCFGTLLFPSANGKVDSRYLSILQELDNVSCFAWGVAVHQDLLDCLTQRKVKKTSNISGCLILLQIWCYEHIIIGRPNLLDSPSTFPRVCRWESSARHYLTSSQFTIKFEELEHTQILWRLKPTSEEIQIDMIREIPKEWYLCTGLGTMEQRLDLESENTIRMFRAQKQGYEEQESILKTGCGTMEQPIDVVSERAIRIVRAQREEEPIIKTGYGTMEQPIDAVSERAIRMVRAQREEEPIIKTGYGTMEQPIDVVSERAIRMVRVQMEVGQPARQEKSMIVVSSDDDETKVIEDLKSEILKLKVIIEDQRKDKEALKRVEDENDELRKDNEELRKLVEKLHCRGMLMDNWVSNLERIVSESDDDNVGKL